jgi:hypothetical protein
MATKHNSLTLNKVGDHEEIFVLRRRRTHMRRVSAFLISI